MYRVAKGYYACQRSRRKRLTPRVTATVRARILLHTKDKQPQWTGKVRTQGKYQSGLSGKPALGMTPLSSRYAELVLR